MRDAAAAARRRFSAALPGARLRWRLRIDNHSIQIAAAAGGTGYGPQPAVALLRSQAAAARPVRAAGWAGAWGAADVTVAGRGGGEVRLGLAVGRSEAEWLVAAMACMWLELAVRQ